MNPLSIVMYHYVRPIAGSDFPGIKGLELEGFRRQLDYLEANYNFVTVDDIVQCLKQHKPLPDQACWLTFDDGYKDHIQYVLPELLARGIQGAFFPPAQVVSGNHVLDVNAVHHILASVDNVLSLKQNMEQLCKEQGFVQSQLDRLWSEYGKPNRFDNAETIYVKRLLQHALPEDLRNHVTRVLFKQHVGVGLEAFSKSLYLSMDDARTLVKEGMYVGSHGDHHYWLDRLSPEQQRGDIEASLRFLESIGSSTADWVMCYPYGAYNEATLGIANDLGAALGITTVAEQAVLHQHQPLILPRFDTNDFPQ